MAEWYGEDLAYIHDVGHADFALQTAPGILEILAQSGTVGAKTGTAEVVTNGKVGTNGWMVGYRGDVAFAVIVEGGESGGKAAGPIVKNFLSKFK